MSADPVRARLAELRSVQTGGDSAADLLHAAVTAVLDLHKPSMFDRWARPTYDVTACASSWCNACRRTSYAASCATVLAVSAALVGVTE